MSLSVVIWRKTKWSCAIAVLAVAGSLSLQAQTNWEFVSGSIEGGAPGVYTGASQHPAAREGAVSWTGADGTFWMFGGENTDNDYLNDFWKYDASIRKWEFVSGTDDYINERGVYSGTTPHPGSREYAVAWTDSAGDLWLFSGYGYAESGGLAYLNDLWKYDVSEGKWAFISGTGDYKNEDGNYDNSSGSAHPASRDSAASWTDNAGDLWLFGGGQSAILNDLWKFDVSEMKWQLVSGTGDYWVEYGIYGGATPHPGSRANPLSWTDGAGDLWMFGGYGYAESESAAHLNDLWKFDVVELKWEFVSGTGDYRSEYGNYDNAGGTAYPGSRGSATTWTDGTSLWLLGGWGYAETSQFGFESHLNDLWKYDIAEAKWLFVSGTGDYKNQHGIYDNSGGSAHPGSRRNAVSWVDNAGDLWLFSGYGYPADHAEYRYSDALNDLWRYRVPVVTSATDWTLYE